MSSTLFPENRPHSNDYRIVLSDFKIVSYCMSADDLATTFAFFFQAYLGPYQLRHSNRSELYELAHRLEVAPVPSETLTKWKNLGWLDRTEALHIFANRVITHPSNTRAVL